MQRDLKPRWEPKGILPSGHAWFDEITRGRKHRAVPQWPVQAYVEFQRRLVEADQLSLLQETLKEWVAPASHSDAIAVFISDTLSRSRIELGLAVATQRLAQVQRRVLDLERWQQRYEGRLAALERVAPAQTAHSEIEWDQVKETILNAATALGWQARVEVSEEDARVRVLLPAEQEDLLVKASLEFYERLSARLGAVFRTIAFELDVDE